MKIKLCNEEVQNSDLCQIYFWSNLTVKNVLLTLEITPSQAHLFHSRFRRNQRDNYIMSRCFCCRFLHWDTATQVHTTLQIISNNHCALHYGYSGGLFLAADRQFSPKMTGEVLSLFLGYRRTKFSVLIVAYLYWD